MTACTASKPLNTHGKPFGKPCSMRLRTRIIRVAFLQISVYKDKLMIWNEGQLPEDWTIETLLEKHSSKPYNPDIATALFRSGYIESWGRGISKMTEQCLEMGLPEPTFYYRSSGFWVEFKKDVYNIEHLGELGLNDRQLD